MFVTASYLLRRMLGEALPGVLFAVSAACGVFMWTLGIAGGWSGIELAGGLLMMVAIFTVIDRGVRGC
jgi:hypothetical protein